MIKVLLNGAVTSLESKDHHHACHSTHRIVATTLDPVLPDGDWIEVTSIGSDMREFASADRIWACEERGQGYLS